MQTSSIRHILIAFFLSLSLWGFSNIQDSTRTIIKENLKQGVISYQKNQLGDALEYFDNAYNMVSDDYTDPLTLNVIKNYTAILGLTKRNGRINEVANSVLPKLPYDSCSAKISSLVIGTLVNFHGAATFQNDQNLSERILKYTSIAFHYCNHDSINLAQINLNAAKLALRNNDNKKAEELLKVSKKYENAFTEGSEYDGTLYSALGHLERNKGNYQKAQELLIISSKKFLLCFDPKRAVDPLDWAFENLSPYLDSASNYQNTARMIFLRDSLNFTSSLDQIKLLNAIAKNQKVNEELRKKETIIYQVSLAWALFVILLVGTFIFFYQTRMKRTIYDLNSTVVAYQEKTSTQELTASIDIESTIVDVREQLTQKPPENHFHLEEIIRKSLPEIFSSGSIIEKLKEGEKAVFYMILIKARAKEAALILNTSENSFRVRKSKLINNTLNDLSKAQIGNPVIVTLLNGKVAMRD